MQMTCGPINLLLPNATDEDHGNLYAPCILPRVDKGWDMWCGGWRTNQNKIDKIHYGSSFNLVQFPCLDKTTLQEGAQTGINDPDVIRLTPTHLLMAYTASYPGADESGNQLAISDLAYGSWPTLLHAPGNVALGKASRPTWILNPDTNRLEKWAEVEVDGTYALVRMIQSEGDNVAFPQNFDLIDFVSPWAHDACCRLIHGKYYLLFRTDNEQPWHIRWGTSLDGIHFDDWGPCPINLAGTAYEKYGATNGCWVQNADGDIQGIAFGLATLPTMEGETLGYCNCIIAG